MSFVCDSGFLHDENGCGPGVRNCMCGRNDVMALGHVRNGMLWCAVSMHGVVSDDGDVVIVFAFSMQRRGVYGVYGGVRW